MTRLYTCTHTRCSVDGGRRANSTSQPQECRSIACRHACSWIRDWNNSLILTVERACILQRRRILSTIQSSFHVTYRHFSDWSSIHGDLICYHTTMSRTSRSPPILLTCPSIPVWLRSRVLKASGRLSFHFWYPVFSLRVTHFRLSRTRTYTLPSLSESSLSEFLPGCTRNRVGGRNLPLASQSPLGIVSIG